MSLKVTCEPCKERMSVLYQTTVSATEIVYVMHCLKCGGRVAVQNEGAKTFKSIQSVKSGASLIPRVAPAELRVDRIPLTPEQLHARLMGRPKK